ncbi:MM3350-like domain-containing protein [Mycena sp. CBHHK59/15]|nr:MM3350-like domain-containing protein [Mycena sp. CBHHK59/15]
MPPYTASTESIRYQKKQEKLLKPRIINGKQTFVKFLPQDDLEAIHPVYLSDPYNFVPRRHQTGEMLGWGIVELDNSVQLSLMETIQRRMKQDGAAVYMYHGQLKPQVQFINTLMDRKKAKIAASRDPQRESCDYILSVRLRDPQPATPTSAIMWRKIKVSGATRLSTFQDKILTPALGWTRNYHGYLFVDDSDGAQYGADGGSHVDLIHLHDNGHTYLDDHEFTLADVFGTSVNDKKPAFLYIYDLGDYWLHDIYINVILPPAESDGKVALLAGEGACPREDGQGNRNWIKYIASLDAAKHAEIAASSNYCGDPEVRRLDSRWRLDPRKCDLTAARKRIADALASPASVPSGPKKAVFGDPYASMGTGGNALPPKGTHHSVTPMGPELGLPFGKNSGLTGAFQFHQTETVRDRRDKKSSALCACCGKPIQNPKTCSACRKVYYCDQDCQGTHWKEHKRQCACAT